MIGSYHYDVYTIDSYRASNNNVLVYIFNHTNTPSLIEKLYGKEEDLILLVLEAMDIIWEQIEEHSTKEMST